MDLQRLTEMKARSHSISLRIDLENELLLRGRQEVALAPKVFALLRYFVQHPNQLLTKEAILDNVWPDMYVTEGSIKDYIHDLRKALQDDPKTPHFIETVHRRGYRYIGSISIVTDKENMPFADRGRPSAPAIAVLPFENFSGDERWNRLADGLADDLITALTRFRDILVIARNSSFSYKGKSIDVRQIGRALSADYILEGSIQASEEQIRVTVQLVSAGDGSHLWARRYDYSAEDIFAIQDAIVEQVLASFGDCIAKFHAKNA